MVLRVSAGAAEWGLKVDLALQNQKRTHSLVQVGNAQQECLHPDCKIPLLGTRAATVALPC